MSQDTIKYEYDSLDDLLLRSRTYVLAFEGLMETYNSNRRRYEYESLKEAIDLYPEIFEKDYAPLIACKRRVQLALEKWRLERPLEFKFSKGAGLFVGTIDMDNQQLLEGVE